MKLPSSACITLLVLYGAEMALIFTLNFLIILVFVRNRSLRKRSMYLVINLAVTDMLIAAFPVPYNYFYIGQMCSIWKVQHPIGFEVLFWLWNVFPIASLTNLAAISIERVHATFRPFKHRVITKRVYGAIIAANWLLTVLLTSYLLVTYKTEGVGYYVWNSFNAICLFVICVSYVSIAVKVYCRTPPQHHRAVSREKKLTKTLFIVTLVSLLLWLPYTVCSFLYYSTDIATSLSPLAIHLLSLSCFFLFTANSLVNPILYAIRMPDLRSALILRCRRNRQRQRTVTPFLRGKT